MNALSTALPASLLGALITGSIAAQDEGEAPKKQQRTREMKLAQACANMANLESLAFTTTHTTTNRVAMIVMQGGGKFRGKTIASKGIWHKDLLKVEVGDDDQFIFRGRRMIASNDDSDWALRRAKTADGQELFFALDPGVLFAGLANTRFKVTHQGVGMVANRPVETYTIRLKGDDARTLLWSGAIPKDDGKTGGRANGAGGAMVFRAFGGVLGGAADARVKIHVDLAISIDPATKLVLRVHGRSFVEGRNQGLPARVVINGVGGVQLEQEEEEEDKEKAKSGALKNGLPIPEKSTIKKSTVVEFTFDFTGHNQTTAPKLSSRARKLLGLAKD